MAQFLTNLTPTVHVDENNSKFICLNHTTINSNLLLKVGTVNQHGQNIRTLPDIQESRNIDSLPTPHEHRQTSNERFCSNSFNAVQNAADRQTLSLLQQELIHRFDQSHRRHHHRRRNGHHPCEPSRLSHHRPFSQSFPPSHPTSTQSLEARPVPDKYSSKVIATVPLAHIWIYRSCMRLTNRPHMFAAHVSAGMAVGVVAYGRQTDSRRVRAC